MSGFAGSSRRSHVRSLLPRSHEWNISSECSEVRESSRCVSHMQHDHGVQSDGELDSIRVECRRQDANIRLRTRDANLW
jgi:hypothetical protein